MMPLTDEENRSYEDQEVFIYVRKSFVWMNMMKILKIKKRLKITVITQENLEELPIAIEI